MALAIVLTVVKGAIAWFVLMFIGTQLTGMIVGGPARPMTTPDGVHPFVAAQYAKARRSTTVAAMISSLLALGYLALLFRFWNIGVVLAAILLMVARVPDLLAEMRTGEKVGARGMAGHMAATLSWLALPILWLSLWQSEISK